MIIRPSPAGTERHTLDNILETGSYTLNPVLGEHAASAHQTSVRYNRCDSEFDSTDFSEHWVEGIAAPFVEQAPIHIGLSLAEHQVLAINGVHLVIGRIDYLAYPEEQLRDDGSLDLADIGTLVAAGLDSYHEVNTGVRFRYAKPDQPPQRVP